MAKAIATVGGIALAPGVSRNGRLYTKAAIAGMVARAQDRIADGNMVLTDASAPADEHLIGQLTHHAAGDDSTRIVGRLTALTVDEAGRARFRAEIAPTAAGRTIAALLDPSDGAPFLRGVSIRAAWVGGARVADGPDGPVETGDDLELNGLDYTHKPGVDAAAVDTFAWTQGGARTETADRVLITESVEAALVSPISEDTEPAGPEPGHVCEPAEAVAGPETPHIFEASGGCAVCEAGMPFGKRTTSAGPGGPYADPGYQPDKKPRYQLDTKAHAKAAWAYISQAGNAKVYSGSQLKRIKGRIVKALKGFGVSTAAESAGWAFDGPVALAAVAEYYAGLDVSSAGSWSISASNGPVNLSLSCYGMDPAEMDVILRAAAAAACQALAALDPDMDGDIDVDGAPNADTDGDGGETAPDTDSPAVDAGQAGEATEADPAASPAPEPAAGTTEHEEDSVMAESSTPAAGQTAPALTQADVTAAVASALDAERVARRARKAKKAQKESAAAAKSAVAETAPAAAPAAPAAEVAESVEDKVARLVKARMAEEFPEETEDERIDRLVGESLDAARATAAANGTGQVNRKGVVRRAEETAGAGDSINEATGLPASWGDKPLHEMSTDELNRKTGPVIVRHVLGTKADSLS